MTNDATRKMLECPSDANPSFLFFAPYEMYVSEERL